MNLRFITIITILIASCKSKTADWQTLDFKAFTLKTPQGWRIMEAQGIDSYVGSLTNGRDTLSFDYGWYTVEINDEGHESHLYGQDTINGLTAVIQIPKVDGKGSIAMSIPHVTGQNKFGISGANIRGTDTILQIFKSITFKASDTTKNNQLTKAKFKQYPYGSGRTLYYAYCSACHAINKQIEGPSIKNLVENRNGDWVYQFLTNRKLVASDQLYQARIKEFGMRCMEFNNLSKIDIEQIVGYIKAEN